MLASTHSAGLSVWGPVPRLVTVASQMSRSSYERPMLATSTMSGCAAAMPCTASVSSAYGRDRAKVRSGAVVPAASSHAPDSDGSAGGADQTGIGGRRQVHRVAGEDRVITEGEDRVQPRRDRRAGRDAGAIGLRPTQLAAARAEHDRLAPHTAA